MVSERFRHQRSHVGQLHNACGVRNGHEHIHRDRFQRDRQGDERARDVDGRFCLPHATVRTDRDADLRQSHVSGERNISLERLGNLHGGEWSGNDLRQYCHDHRGRSGGALRKSGRERQLRSNHCNDHLYGEPGGAKTTICANLGTHGRRYAICCQRDLGLERRGDVYRGQRSRHCLRRIGDGDRHRPGDVERQPGSQR